MTVGFIKIAVISAGNQQKTLVSWKQMDECKFTVCFLLQITRRKKPKSTRQCSKWWPEAIWSAYIHECKQTEVKTIRQTASDQKLLRCRAWVKLCTYFFKVQVSWVYVIVKGCVWPEVWGLWCRIGMWVSVNMTWLLDDDYGTWSLLDAVLQTNTWHLNCF